MPEDAYDRRADDALMAQADREALPVSAAEVLLWATALRRLGSPDVRDLADAMTRRAESVMADARTQAQALFALLPLDAVEQAARSVNAGADRETEAQWLVTEALDGERASPDVRRELEAMAREALVLALKGGGDRAGGHVAAPGPVAVGSASGAS